MLSLPGLKLSGSDWRGRPKLRIAYSSLTLATWLWRSMSDPPEKKDSSPLEVCCPCRGRQPSRPCATVLYRAHSTSSRTGASRFLQASTYLEPLFFFLVARLSTEQHQLRRVAASGEASVKNPPQSSRLILPSPLNGSNLTFSSYWSAMHSQA